MHGGQPAHFEWNPSSKKCVVKSLKLAIGYASPMIGMTRH
jgi:hypothetical protein